MTKVIAINGSPRKKWNTAQLLEESLRGAQAAGVETNLIHLQDLQFKGCCSCFGCKRKGAEPFRCCQKDDLSPVLERVLTSDVLLLGSPIYVGDITGQMRSFLERLAFITLSYDDTQAIPFPGAIDSAFFFTMGITPEYSRIYEPVVKTSLNTLKWLGGSTESYICANTLQFDDYSKYNAASFNEEDKLTYRKEQFPKDLQAAYEIGRRLASGKPNM